MRQLPGQAFALCLWLGRLLMGLVLLGGIGVGALVWRLDQGPIWLPQLAAGIGDALESEDLPRVTIDNAGIAWTGWRAGQLSPIHFLVTGIQVLDDAGLVRASMPQATVSLSVPWLLRGRLAPRAITLEAPSLTLVRQEDGSITTDLGIQVEGANPPSAAGETGLGQLFALPGPGDPVSALRQLRLTGGRVVLLDRQLRRSFIIEGIELLLERQGAVLTAALDARLLLGQGGPGERGAEAVPLHLSARTDPALRVVQARLSVPALRPAALAGLVPALAPLAMIEAEAGLEATVSLDAAGRPSGGGARLTLGAGRVTVEGQAIALAGAELRASATPDRAVLEALTLRLAPVAREAGPPPASRGPAAARGEPAAAARAEAAPAAPTLTLTGQAARQPDGHWQAGAELGLDRLAMRDLAAYWPASLGRNVRSWLVENVTAGLARDGRWRIQARANDDLSGAEVTAASGTLAMEGATVHWLRPIPPVENATGSIAFSLTEVLVRARGRQAGTSLELRDGSMRFYDLDTGKENAQIDLRLAGPVADALALIKHPRLKLFDKRPLEIRDATGSLEATTSIGFPLLADLPVELINVRTQLRATALRIPDLVMGQTLERGTMEMTVDTNGLRASGTATLADVPAKLGVEMDFRNGPGTQVVARERAELRLDAQQLTRFGLDVGDIVTGPVAIEARTERRRNGQAAVAIKGDLRDATMGVGALAWRKPPGTPGTVEASLRLTGQTLVSAEALRIEAGDFRGNGRIVFLPGTRIDRVELAQGELGASRFRGEIRPPAEPRGPWRFTLNGPVADLTAILAEDKPRQPDPADPDSLPVLVEADFARVVLGEGRALTGVAGRVRSDNRGVVMEARVTGATGRAAQPGRFEITVAPAGAGRTLRASAQDGGALLRAFDVLTSVQGGQLAVEARWTGNQPGAALTGNARLDDFAVAGAPAVGKLLQALTLYGVFDAARGGAGLSFSRAEIPFTLQPHVLTLGDSRAFSASLGVTLQGRIDRIAQRIDLQGTIVPAYVLNSMLGSIPLLGRLFSAERGGGLISVNWRVRGKLDDPDVSVNPLSALTPGFLRGLFGGGGQ